MAKNSCAKLRTTCAWLLAAVRTRSVLNRQFLRFSARSWVYSRIRAGLVSQRLSLWRAFPRLPGRLFPPTGAVQCDCDVRLFHHEDRDMLWVVAESIWLFLDKADGKQDTAAAADGLPGPLRLRDRERDAAAAARGLRA